MNETESHGAAFFFSDFEILSCEIANGSFLADRNCNKTCNKPLSNAGVTDRVCV